MRGIKSLVSAAACLSLFVFFICSASGQAKKTSKAPETNTPMSQSVRDAKAKQESERIQQWNLALMAAVAAGDIGSIKSALDNGAKVNAGDREGMTALAQAALRGDPNVVKFLIENGADVNSADIFGATPLIQASWAGHADVVEILVASGANPNIKSTLEVPSMKKKGVNALMAASMNGSTEVVQMLLNREVKLNQQDAEGQTALMYGCKSDKPDVVKLLLSAGAKIELKDQFGRTALCVATMYGSIDAVALLLSAGANVDARDIHNKKPIVYASALDRPEIYKLLQAGAARRRLPAEGGGNSVPRNPVQSN
jgi:uncharacterized protein